MSTNQARGEKPTSNMYLPVRWYGDDVAVFAADEDSNAGTLARFRDSVVRLGLPTIVHKCTAELNYMGLTIISSTTQNQTALSPVDGRNK